MPPALLEVDTKAPKQILDKSLKIALKNSPTGTDITALGQALGYEREVIRIWFCNKRQALKNTVRMMSKGMPN